MIVTDETREESEVLIVDSMQDLVRLRSCQTNTTQMAWLALPSRPSPSISSAERMPVLLHIESNEAWKASSPFPIGWSLMIFNLADDIGEDRTCVVVGAVAGR